jgi:anaerobic glycerol-3-phosphate dehydrogenase
MLTTQQINSELKIIKLGTQKFKTALGYYQPTGYALKHPELGYFSFEEDKKDYPYSPVGGRKVLKSILEAGGLLNFDNAKWLQEM